MKRKIFITILFCLIANTLFALESMTQFEERIIDETLIFRMNLTSYNSDDAIKKIDEYADVIAKPETQNLLSDEIKLVLENMLVWEKYNYIYKKDMKSELLEPLIKNQYNKVKEWFSSKKDEKHNKWLYCTAGDVLSSCMQFLPVTTAMKEGITVKKYYDAVLEQDPTMTFCLMNIGQWYFFAPAFGGGSKKKALDCFNKAVLYSQNDAEYFYAKIYLSQMCFENEDLDKAASFLEEASKVLPSNLYTPFIKKINDAGYSLYYYTMNREKVDKELSK